MTKPKPLPSPLSDGELLASLDAIKQSIGEEKWRIVTVTLLKILSAIRVQSLDNSDVLKGLAVIERLTLTHAPSLDVPKHVRTTWSSTPNTDQSNG